jgi:hypothetical protein
MSERCAFCGDLDIREIEISLAIHQVKEMSKASE